jgi:hypothetical protein
VAVADKVVRPQLAQVDRQLTERVGAVHEHRDAPAGGRPWVRAPEGRQAGGGGGGKLSWVQVPCRQQATSSISMVGVGLCGGRVNPKP